MDSAITIIIYNSGCGCMFDSSIHGIVMCLSSFLATTNVVQCKAQTESLGYEVLFFLKKSSACVIPNGRVTRSFKTPLNMHTSTMNIQN